MCHIQLIETLRMEDGVLQRLPYHEARYKNAMRHFWHETCPKKLAQILADNGLKTDGRNPGFTGTYKVRVEYCHDHCSVQATPYRPKHVASLRMVAGDGTDYHYKYADRSALAKCLERRDGCDEVIIVKDGLLTDTSYSNIAFFDGTHWLTPRVPLLAGTMRSWLLDNGLAKEADIRPADLGSFSKASLINAMLPLGELTVPTSEIK